MAKQDNHGRVRAAGWTNRVGYITLISRSPWIYRGKPHPLFLATGIIKLHQWPRGTVTSIVTVTNLYESFVAAFDQKYMCLHVEYY